jgi:hypothetical protein
MFSAAELVFQSWEQLTQFRAAKLNPLRKAEKQNR